MSRGSVLPAGLVLSGEIRGQGDLVVAGTIEGPVQIDGHLVIEAGASVRGDVKARSIVLRGTLLGPAVAEETIKLESGARMVGDARAERVSVIEGALLRGRITMTGVQPTRRSSAGALSAVGPAERPVERPSRGEPIRELASPIARSSAGVLVAPRAPRGEAPPTAFDEDNRTNRFLRPTDLQVSRSETPPAPVPPVQARPVRAEPAAPGPAAPGPVGSGLVGAGPVGAGLVGSGPVGAGPVPPPPARTRERRPPEPVIPGVGRQRARRKDGGLPT